LQVIQTLYFLAFKYFFFEGCEKLKAFYICSPIYGRKEHD
jgi:hypothetical protein